MTTAHRPDHKNQAYDRDRYASVTAAPMMVQRELQAVYDLLPDAYLVTDSAGVIQQANPATSALVGYARAYVLGKPFTVLLDPRTAESFATKLAALRQAPADRRQTWALQLRPRHDGPPVQAQVWVAPIHDEAGTLTGFRWLLRDVTDAQTTAAALERLRTEQAKQLRTQTMELEAVVRMQAAQLAEARASEQAVQRLVTAAVRALQHGAAAGPLLGELLAGLQAHGLGPALGASQAPSTEVH